MANRQPHHLLYSPTAQQGGMMRHGDEMQLGWGLQSFDAAAHLQDEETIRAYLQAAIDDPTPGALWLALDVVIRARDSLVREKELSP
ncbi:hypothetical protein AAA533_07415 [Pseudomonas aeruginosa]|uniref:helix-turn-helix domain-containing transcriptional regulator n=2 Tax=Pseudomonas aeruginosa TaxID=287 RepID=UPI000F53BDB6|nr:hypothetical protein [Pseudomonas aeruginosa]EKU8667784.1 hypothetical protein [Pseudomonas aeruginosa]MBG6354631.1 hypothetical protein [Pseudomonas aeruginosa]MBM2555770.1 hypothetical protein [Pseudomonas aeruginosa]MCT5883143.1 hypothetical protein [Pseudomonas aeruginosa]MYM49486.1 hypothetical protein [Pseudomonas aeruginosa]